MPKINLLLSLLFLSMNIAHGYFIGQVDGHWGSWSSWTICTTSCGNGTKVRTRNCTYTDGVPRGYPCGGTHSETTSCNPTPCPVDGVWSLWGMMSPCSVTCGDGERTRTRTCIFPAGVPHGKNCTGHSTIHTSCTKAACAATTTSTTTPEPTGDGSWSAWTEWTSCTATCDSGTHSRNRTCLYPPNLVHGHVCSGPSTQTDNCNINLCPRDGHLGAWYGWSRCSQSCGNGTHTRKRDCQFNPHYPRGNNCTAPLQETGTCNSGLCPVDGTWSFWTTWDSCSKSCGNGIQSRSRTCEYPDGVSHGEDCHGISHENRTCNSSPCPVNGSWDEWSPWSHCLVSCGNGTEQRARKCQFDPKAPKGEPCHGNDRESKECFQGLCPKDGKLSSWSSWTGCSLTCGNGTRSRSRSCVFEDGYPHGKDCEEPISSTEPCSTKPCTVDGAWKEWSVWSFCTATCHGGVRTRIRTCEYTADGPRGLPCLGSASETQSCADELCPAATQSSFTCATCGDNTPDVCEFLYEQNTGCPDPYCISIVRNPDTGERTVERKCGNLQECKTDWWHQTSQIKHCNEFNANFIYTQTFECTYCCTTPNCNDDIHPADTTLYKENY